MFYKNIKKYINYVLFNLHKIMKLTEQQLNTFRDIYLRCYGISLSEDQVNTEITDLLKTIININKRNP